MAPIKNHQQAWYVRRP